MLASESELKVWFFYGAGKGVDSGEIFVLLSVA